MDIDDLISYCEAILPLVIAHVVVPPLSVLQPIPREKLNEPLDQYFSLLYKYVPEDLRKKSFVESLLLDTSGNGNWSSWITHMFVHANYNHMFSNLTSLVALGHPVYKEYGALGLNVMFLVGGVFASLPITEKFYSVFPTLKPAPVDLIPGIPAPLNTYVNKLTSVVNLFSKKLGCGSSGGVCALLGCNFVLLVRHCYNVVGYIRDALTGTTTTNDRTPENESNRNSASYSSFSKGLTTTVQMYDLFWTSLSALTILQQMRDEMVNMQSQSSKPLTVWSLINPESAVGHGVHVQGFLFGASITASMLYWKRRKMQVGVSGRGY
jgi:membrane associated rhomboid family serine protease